MDYKATYIYLYMHVPIQLYRETGRPIDRQKISTFTLIVMESQSDLNIILSLLVSPVVLDLAF